MPPPIPTNPETPPKTVPIRAATPLDIGRMPFAIDVGFWINMRSPASNKTIARRAVNSVSDMERLPAIPAAGTEVIRKGSEALKDRLLTL